MEIDKLKKDDSKKIKDRPQGQKKAPQFAADEANENDMKIIDYFEPIINCMKDLEAVKASSIIKFAVIMFIIMVMIWLFFFLMQGRSIELKFN